MCAGTGKADGSERRGSNGLQPLGSSVDSWESGSSRQRSSFASKRALPRADAVPANAEAKDSRSDHGSRGADEWQAERSRLLDQHERDMARLRGPHQWATDCR